EEEEGSFKAIGEPVLDGDAIALLFAFIKSRKSNLPLLVKAAPEKAPRLMAALARMLPQASIPDMTFVTNHNENGLRAGINICFISPNYRFEIFPNAWVVLDLNAGQRPDTQECAMFAPMVEKYLRAGQLQKVRAIAAWCLSSVYEASKSASPSTQKALFAFIHDFDAFDEGLIASDDKLRELLIAFLRQNPEEKLKLERRLDDKLSRIDLCKDLKSWINYVRKIRPIDMGGVAAKNKKHINDLIFDDSKSFLSFYDSYSDIWPEIVRDYVDPERFTLKSYFISNFKSKQWEALYPYFLKEILDAKETDKLILRMIDDDVDRDTRKRIMNKEIPDKRRQAEALCAILASSPDGQAPLIINMLVDVCRCPELRSDPVDCFKTFEANLSSPQYAPLFECSLELSDFRSVGAIRAFIERVKAFLDNPNGGNWLGGREGQKTFTRLFDSLLTGVKSGSIGRDEARAICDEITSLSVSSDNRQLSDPSNIRQTFSHLSRAFERSKYYDDDEVGTLWGLAAELGDKEYQSILAPDMLSYVERVNANLLYKESHDYPDGLIAYLVKEGMISEDQVLAIASKSDRPKFYWLALMRMKGGKPQDEYDFLTQKARMSDKDALEFLGNYSKESYRKILKSRQPSVWSKISGGLKCMFSKKDKSDDDSKGGSDGTPRGPQGPQGAPNGGARNAASYSDARPESYNPSQNRRRR
ncbi:MAG: hypothetical protein K2H72_09640, partial [Muribaculaceae bacterium]|nr:hypothetical protein [Muribaculaceae bacterium]